MKLSLFEFIDKTLAYYEMKTPSYGYVEGQLGMLFTNLMKENADKVVSFHSRIKKTESLKEKLIRNQFYLNYEAGKDAIDHLSDLIGFTIQVRFIRNEEEIYRSLFSRFVHFEGDYYRCIVNPDVYLNLNMEQPQLQRNGFEIYRIDGYYVFNGEHVNFELQIKSLVHNFWNDIEHEVVYKNPDFTTYNLFNRNMLGAIRDNLDVVDRQLEIMYNQISEESSATQIGMNEMGFKIFVTRSINELANRKMKTELGFISDFKKESAMLAQFIYIRYFVNGTHNRETMVDFLEHLNYLSGLDIVFTEEVFLEEEYHGESVFTDVLGRFWESAMNTDFSWHVFFIMLFSILQGTNSEDFHEFVSVSRTLFILPAWYESRFRRYSDDYASHIRDELERAYAEELVRCGKTKIIYEENVIECAKTFRDYVEKAEIYYASEELMKKNEDRIIRSLREKIALVFGM